MTLVLTALAVLFVLALAGAVLAMRRDRMMLAAFALGVATAAFVHIVWGLL